jgi:hydroxyacylglutathione hydrolase
MEHINLLDVRRRSEYDSEHIVGGINFPLDFINYNMSQLDRNKKYYIYCAGGYRSAIMCSILKARGFDRLVNIVGGYKALGQTRLQKTVFKEPVTML